MAIADGASSLVHGVEATTNMVDRAELEFPFYPTILTMLRSESAVVCRAVPCIVWLPAG